MSLPAHLSRLSAARIWISAAAVVVAFGVHSIAARGESDLSLDTVLARAGLYVGNYHNQSATVICDERYLQEVWESRKMPAAKLGMAWETVRTGKRRLSSEFLLVWVPAAAAWAGFRDVAEVDGRPVRDRASRLDALMRRSDASEASLKALADESARFNIGPADRNFNDPTLALRVLDPSRTAHFHFRKIADARIADTPTWRIEYLETAQPTMIQKWNRDAPAHGQLWIEPERGFVVRTELDVPDPATGARATIVVDYGIERKLDLWVPRTMTESYEGGVTRVKGTAEYLNFRRFETSGKVLVPK